MNLRGGERLRNQPRKAGVETDDFLILLGALAHVCIKISLHFVHE